MRGSDDQNGSLFSYVNLEERIPARHPLRKIREVVNAALVTLDGDFDRLYAGEGRPSIAPRSVPIRHSYAEGELAQTLIAAGYEDCDYVVI